MDYAKVNRYISKRMRSANERGDERHFQFWKEMYIVLVKKRWAFMFEE